jgi:hypothetical protein
MYNVTQLLIARGFLEAAGILASVNFELFEATNDFNDEFVVLYARASLPQYEFFRENIKEKDFKNSFKTLREVICEIGPYVRIIACELDLAIPPHDWKTDLNNTVTRIYSNQAVFTYKDGKKFVHQGLNFRSKTEIKIFDALVVQEVLVLPLPVAVMGKARLYREPDFLVCYRSKWGILEIYGDKWHPPETAAKEHERRRMFTKLGVKVYEIFDATKCWEQPEKVVNEFLEALKRT